MVVSSSAARSDGDTRRTMMSHGGTERDEKGIPEHDNETVESSAPRNRNRGGGMQICEEGGIRTVWKYGQWVKIGLWSIVTLTPGQPFQRIEPRCISIL